MLTRLGGLLLIVGALLAAFLGFLGFRGEPVGIGGADVNGQYALAALTLTAGGATALVVGGAPLFGRAIRVAIGVLAAGLILTATSFVGGETAGLLLAIGGLFLTAIGFVALGGALVRSPGAGKWVGAGLLAGVVLVLVGALGPSDIRLVALAGVALLVASTAALGVVAIRATPAEA